MLTTLLLTAVTVLPAAQVKKGPEVKGPPQKMELFAREAWYRTQEGQEEDFVGMLSKADNKGAAIGRINPYRMECQTTEMVSVEKEITMMVGNELRKVKVVEQVPVTKVTIREVYVGGNARILDPYVGKVVKMTGKPITVTVDGRTHFEIWPARIEFIELKVPTVVDPKDFLPPPKKGEADGCDDDQDKQITIQAKARWPFVSADPGGDKKGKQLVLRSANELVNNSPYMVKAMAIETLEKQATAEIAKLFKVDTIDWTKQMVVVVTGGVKSTGGYKIDIISVTVSGKGATVEWKLEAPDGIATQAFTHPAVMALMDRVEGDVSFVRKN